MTSSTHIMYTLSRISAGLGLLPGRGLAVCPGQAGWREWSLFTLVTAAQGAVGPAGGNRGAALLQVAQYSGQYPALMSSSQNLSLGLLGLCYLTTGPEAAEAVALLRAASLASLVDTGLSLSEARARDKEAVAAVCGAVRALVVGSMAIRIINTIVRYEDVIV